MKLARKFALALLLGIVAFLAVQGYVRARREIDLIERDTIRDQKDLGVDLALAVTSIWTVADKKEALDFIDQANKSESKIEIRWVWLDAPQGSPYLPVAPRHVLDPLSKGKPVTWIDRERGGVGYITTYIPVPLAGEKPGGLELSESLLEERQLVRTTVVRILITTGIIAALCGFLAMILGIWFVGKPVQQLIEKARRVSTGDFTGRLALRQKDELSQLAEELNLMSSKLGEANQRLSAETAARITAIEQLRHADRLMTVGKLASGIAHELGTPLNVVIARAKMVQAADPKEETIDENARIIVEQAEGMTRIIRQILNFARPRRPLKRRVDLCELARRTLSLLQPMADKRGVSLALEDPQGPVFAEVDSDQSQQVVSNLVMNGIQAMKRQGKVTVRASCEQVRPPLEHGGPEAQYVRVDVEDEGEGIPEENLPHLFDPFFSTKDVGEGTGLGLSVSRGIVMEHGGWIATRSALGRGSCFSVYFPERMA